MNTETAAERLIQSFEIVETQTKTFLNYIRFWS